MTSIFTWCVIVNLRTCSAREWKKWKSRLEDHHIKNSFHFSDSLPQLADLLSALLHEGRRHFLFAGGDGSLHHGANLLIDHGGPVAHEIVVGVLPCGSGNDWVRTFMKGNIPESIVHEKFAPLHALFLEWGDGRTRYAFNMVGGALDAAVVDSLSNGKFHRAGSLKYGIGLMQALHNNHKWKTKIFIDDQLYAGPWLSFNAGFGKYCGGGMQILPHAQPDKPGVLLMKPKSYFRMLTSAPALYNGNIIHHKEAKVLHMNKIRITADPEPMPIEADGEWLGYSPVTISVRRNVMQRLCVGSGKW